MVGTILCFLIGICATTFILFIASKIAFIDIHFGAIVVISIVTRVVDSLAGIALTSFIPESSEWIFLLGCWLVSTTLLVFFMRKWSNSSGFVSMFLIVFLANFLPMIVF